MLRNFFLAVCLITSPSVLTAASVTQDLNTFAPDDGTSGNGQWVVSTDGTFVQQTKNGLATVFIDPNATSDLNKRITFTVEVTTTSDDDLFGFVLGYEKGDLFAAAPDYILVDWKRATQGVALRGMFMSRVTGPIGNNSDNAASRRDPVIPIARSAAFGDIGWARNLPYAFDISYTSERIDVLVNGVSAFSQTGTFSDGIFGFYNLSQAGVRYSNLVLTDLPPAPIPLPASLPFAFLGAASLYAMRRRRA